MEGRGGHLFFEGDCTVGAPFEAKVDAELNTCEEGIGTGCYAEVRKILLRERY